MFNYRHAIAVLLYYMFFSTLICFGSTGAVAGGAWLWIKTRKYDMAPEEEMRIESIGISSLVFSFGSVFLGFIPGAIAAFIRVGVGYCRGEEIFITPATHEEMANRFLPNRSYLRNRQAHRGSLNTEAMDETMKQYSLIGGCLGVIPPILIAGTMLFIHAVKMDILNKDIDLDESLVTLRKILYTSASAPFLALLGAGLGYVRARAGYALGNRDYEMATLEPVAQEHATLEQSNEREEVQNGEEIALLVSEVRRLERENRTQPTLSITL